MQELMEQGKKLLKTGFFHIFGSSALNKVIAFFTGVVLVRILTKAEYGVYTYAWNIYSLLLILNGMGMESGVLQLASEHSGDELYGRRVSDWGLRFAARFDVVLGLVILLLGRFAPLKIEAARGVLTLLCLLPLVQLLYLMTTAFLRAQKRNREYARLTVLNTALVFVASAGFALLFREKGLVLGYYAAYLVSFVVGLLVFRVKLWGAGEPLGAEDRRSLVRISAVTMCNNGLSQMMYLLDVFVLGLIDPQETILASYRVATLIPTALTFIPLSAAVYLYPYFAEHRGDGAWCLRRYRQVLTAMGALNLLVSAILFAGAPLILRLLFGAEYLDAVPVFRLLAAAYFFSGTFRILSGNLLVTQRKLKFNLIVAVAACAVNVLADWVCVSRWGAMGAAMATGAVVLLTSVLNTAYLVYTFHMAAQKGGAA